MSEYERLDSKWIDEHKHYYPVTAFNNSAKEIVDVEDLQNLLVPKQEEPTQEQVQKYLSEHGIEVVEKPVIPRFVADWIEVCKEFIDYDGSTINIFDSQHETDTNLPLINTATEKERGKVYDWIADYSEKYARAWLDGYTVEKEQKYYVLDKEGHLLIRGFSDGTVGRVGDRMKPDLYPDWNKKNLPLTEQEIKDYDPRYFAFAVKVEELEE